MRCDVIDFVHRDSIATQFTALEVSAGRDTWGRGTSGAGAPTVPGPVDAAQLAALYAYPPSAHPCLRVNFIASIDGAVAVEGRSGKLGGPGDRAVFGLLRSLADVIVVGAGTVRTENYGGARIAEHVQQARRAEGRPPVPRIAVVSASARIDPHHRVFHDTAAPPLLLTSRAAEPARLRALTDAGVETVVLPDLPEDLTPVGAGVRGAGGDGPTPDVGAIAPLLAERGWPRILCEGGPNLTGRLLASGAVDELCLTTAPVLVGGNAPRLAAGGAATPAPMQRRHLLTDRDGALFARWTATDPPGGREARGEQ